MLLAPVACLHWRALPSPHGGAHLLQPPEDTTAAAICAKVSGWHATYCSHTSRQPQPAMCMHLVQRQVAWQWAVGGGHNSSCRLGCCYKWMLSSWSCLPAGSSSAQRFGCGLGSGGVCDRGLAIGVGQGWLYPRAGLASPGMLLRHPVSHTRLVG